MTFYISARSFQPPLVEINGNLFELSYMKDGRKMHLSSEGWDKIQQVFKDTMQSELGGAMDLSSLQRVILSLDTNSLHAWDQSTSLSEKALVCKKVASNTLLLNDLINHHLIPNENKTKEKQRPSLALDLSKPPKTPINNSVQALLTIDDFETICQKDPKQAMALDFKEQFGLLHNESLAYYLSYLSDTMDQSHILLKGDDTRSLFTQRDLLDWTIGDQNRFDRALTSSIDAFEERIYIPLNSLNHYQMIVIDKAKRKIIGYNPKGTFNTDDQLKVIRRLCQLFPNYTFIGDEAFPIDHREEIIPGEYDTIRKTHQLSVDDGNCGIYVINFIHQMQAGESLKNIFKNPVSSRALQRIRNFCADEIRLS